MRLHRENTGRLLESLRLAQARREGRITDDELQLAIQRRERAPSAPRHRHRRMAALLLAACVAALATAAYF
jgi:hypothetical protein